MKNTAAILLLVLSAGLARAEGPPAPNADAGYIQPLNKLTAAEARRLEGKRGLFYVRVEGVGDVCYCNSPDDVVRTCELLPGQRWEERMTVGATLRVYWHPARVIRGRRFAPRVEYRLSDAVRR